MERRITNAVSLLLIFVLLAGNFTACSKEETRNEAVTDEFVSDSFEDTNNFFAGNTEFADALAEFDAGSEDFYSEQFTEDFADFIFDRYSEYVDGVYVSVLTAEEYKNALITLEDGKQLNINKVVKNLVIGGGTIILTAVLLPALVPGLAPRIAVIVTNIVKEALIGAAFDGAIRGVVEYIESGDSQATAYKAIEGASEGFMWGAIIASGTNAITEINAARKAVNLADDAAKQVLRNGEQFDATGHLKPNIRYTTGEFNYIYQTDRYRRPISAEAPELHLVSRGRLKNSTPFDEGWQAGDDAGHIIADRFGGSQKWDNLLWQSSSVNRGAYKKIENELAKALQNGKKASMKVRIEYRGLDKRPYAYHIEYTIDDEFFETTIINIVEKING